MLKSNESDKKLSQSLYGSSFLQTFIEKLKSMSWTFFRAMTRLCDASKNANFRTLNENEKNAAVGSHRNLK